MTSKSNSQYGKNHFFFRGTDGFIFKPNIKKSDILHIFHRDYCRSIPLKFDKEITDPHGIPGYRFVPTSNAFGTPKENPDNACYCNNPGGCPDVPSGVFNVSICQFGSPVMLSWPHFFQADTKLLEAVEGLKPNKNDHQFYIDAQPVSKIMKYLKAQQGLNFIIR